MKTNTNHIEVHIESYEELMILKEIYDLLDDDNVWPSVPNSPSFSQYFDEFTLRGRPAEMIHEAIEDNKINFDKLKELVVLEKLKKDS